MDLNINYEETISTGREIGIKGELFSDLLNKIKQINSELQTDWQGQDASKYSSAVAEQAVEMEKLVETIREIGVFLEKVGQAYKNVSENNASAIN